MTVEKESLTNQQGQPSQGVGYSPLGRNDWERFPLETATATSNAQGYVPASELAGWWGGCCWGRTYVCAAGESCLLGTWFGLGIPCPCFCACRQGKDNTFLHGRAGSQRLVVASKDLLVNYCICMADAPQWTCERKDGCCGC